MAEVVEMSVEDYSAMERKIQIGSDDEMLEIGITVGEYRKRVREAERAQTPETAEAETASLRRQAASAHDAVRVTIQEGRIVASPASKEIEAKVEGEASADPASEIPGRLETAESEQIVTAGDPVEPTASKTRKRNLPAA